MDGWWDQSNSGLRMASAKVRGRVYASKREKTPAGRLPAIGAQPLPYRTLTVTVRVQKGMERQTAGNFAHRNGDERYLVLLRRNTNMAKERIWKHKRKQMTPYQFDLSKSLRRFLGGENGKRLWVGTSMVVHRFVCKYTPNWGYGS